MPYQGVCCYAAPIRMLLCHLRYHPSLSSYASLCYAATRVLLCSPRVCCYAVSGTVLRLGFRTSLGASA
eukprot:2083518-Rhodomonas_salina.1